MATRTLTKIALMACISFVAFTSLSSVLYVEAITLVVVLFAMVFPLQESFWASVVFAMLNMMVQGITIFSMMYLMIYPVYTIIVYYLRTKMLQHRWLLVGVCAFFSFSTGMLLDLPFVLFSNKVTLLYVLLGFKTSLIQGTITGVMTTFIFDGMYRTLLRIERKY